MRPVRPGPKARRAVHFVPALMLVFVALTGSGCASTIIDSAKMEAAVKANMERSQHQGVASVDCPSDQKVQTGAKFVCTIEFSNGTHATSTWKIRNQDADVKIVGFKKTE